MVNFLPRSLSTGSLAVDTWSQTVSVRSQIVTPGFSSKYGVYWSDHPLRTV